MIKCDCSHSLSIVSGLQHLATEKKMPFLQILFPFQESSLLPPPQKLRMICYDQLEFTLKRNSGVA